MSTKQTRRPFSQRPLDLVFFVFFLSHIPATLCIDLQIILPEYFPTVLRDVVQWYISVSKDPILANASSPDFVWLRSIICCEFLFQLPIFFVGVVATWNDNTQRYKNLLLVYGAHVATTLIPIFGTVWFHYTTAKMALSQRLIVSAIYAPYLVIPLLLCWDLGFRNKIVNVGKKKQ
ncbi:transmembrane protein 6/97 [Paraphysoderma sedebokerense]|nr:transmembrane protein 6/97 [Paraphysoderma sedebokerense]